MLNHITIIGRLTRDPELRRTGSGIAVASFTLAVDRDFGGRDGGERETDFIDCVAGVRLENSSPSTSPRAAWRWCPAGSRSVTGPTRTATSAAPPKSLQTTFTLATADVTARPAVTPLPLLPATAVTPLPHPAPHPILQCWMMTTHSCPSNFLATLNFFTLIGGKYHG